MADSSDVRDHFNRLGERSDLSQLKDFAHWGYISDEDWTKLCRSAADFAGVTDGDSVFEAGCGSGAFLAELAAYRKVTLAGVDFAEKLVAIAQSRLVGSFSVADITNLASIPSGTYDRVLSHGVFMYIQTPEAGLSAAREMLRIAKPGGTIYIGIVNDPDRHAEYEHPPSGSFALPRSLWRTFAEHEKLSLEIVDQDRIFSKTSGYDTYSRIRYSLRMGKP
jgi:SAM-dependent methyltransferase